MAAVVAATVVEYLPAPQSVHAAEPVAVLYFPAAHETHDCASGPVEPAGQFEFTQSSRASLPAGELDPAGQAVHIPVSRTGLYVPAGHKAHGPPSTP